ncbi:MULTISPECIES: acetyl-CoA decarbonylase/synthase complex subunit delta [unclassified Methanoregula]|uniref:acetyl-CoA decarbonylase/synthase complex subunit delta n=1 Tax=unclassified Methanoregula TaxID=2649730 RepID=UPI0009CD2C50|nr:MULTISPECIES: acetyl-CoA decarbonylase/synthase complex subunit delta [unclassified Methanoregula]OPX63832.1 MAG: Acetyl-CoA decarbonylase/synthase complex subunit delta [Methanoregula sp. PtaB.Bin085]OPY35237.1 MAG: Acetyl-CoA decarbonylase/synthase complex subunit delta [Methanoregula sp. PtaU1.Bin006]
MVPEAQFGWTGTIEGVTLGATKAEGGTRCISYRIGGGKNLPFLDRDSSSPSPLIAYELCDYAPLWSPIVRSYCGDLVDSLPEWTKTAETTYKPDLIRLHLNSTRQRNFSDIPGLGKTVETVLSATGLPLIIEGSNEPKIDSEVFQRCGESGQGERLLLGTAEASRYRSIAAAALAYNHSVIAQSPIDVNLAKQLNILLKEIGVPRDHIVIDPYTGALGYGFEYSYSAMERIRFAALKGDTDLAMPIICSAADTLTIKEVREADPAMQDSVAVSWELYTGIAAAAAGAEIICVRHPATIGMLRQAFTSMNANTVRREVE